MIKGTTVGLVVKTVLGTDEFNAPIYSTDIVPVSNVLIGEPSADDAATALSLYGKRVAYTLAIPKGDTHDWTDTDVMIGGEKFRTIGYPTEGIEANIPLKWNKKVKVERYG